MVKIFNKVKNDFNLLPYSSHFRPIKRLDTFHLNLSNPLEKAGIALGVLYEF